MNYIISEEELIRLSEFGNLHLLKDKQPVQVLDKQIIIDELKKLIKSNAFGLYQRFKDDGYSHVLIDFATNLLKKLIPQVLDRHRVEDIIINYGTELIDIVEATDQILRLIPQQKPIIKGGAKWKDLECGGQIYVTGVMN